jgi:hypothetical protein
MFTTKRVIALSLAVALIAGTLGVLVGHTQNNYRGVSQTLPTDLTNDYSATSDDLVADFREDSSDAVNDSTYNDSYDASVVAANQQSWNAPVRQTWNAPTRRVVRQAGYSDSQASRERVYYAPQPKKRSFWSKHRDKLTVAAGAGGGAILGGILGGKKWAGIGALIGGGGSALYTYKLRKRAPKN